MRTTMPKDMGPVLIPKRVCAESWWTSAPREAFTKHAAAQQFGEVPPARKPYDRVRTIAEEIVAFGPIE